MKKLVVNLVKQGSGLKGRSQLVDLTPEEVAQKLEDERIWEEGRVKREAVAGRQAELPTDKEMQDALWAKMVRGDNKPSDDLEKRIQFVLNKYPMPEGE
jgi:hypothetical protein